MNVGEPARNEESIDHVEQRAGAKRVFYRRHDHRFAAKHANDCINRNAVNCVALLGADTLDVGYERYAGKLM
jgi:hypothetical protein